MVRALREDDISLDFDYYLREVVLTAIRKGARLLSHRNSENTLQESKYTATFCLNVAQMEVDFNAVRCGDKKVQDAISHNHCEDLLVDSELGSYKNKRSAEALSEAISELLEEEVRFVIAKDCRSLIFWRRHYNVGARQYEAIKLLIKRAKEGHPNVPDSDILVVMDREHTSRVRDSFKRSDLWTTQSKPSLIVSKKRGCRCLVLYPENYEIPT